MGWDVLLFDLDGTLTDSGPGIMHAAETALASFGITGLCERELRYFVGPPLVESFAAYLPQAEVQTAIDRFLTSSNYLSLNNLTLGYTLPKSLVRQLKMDNIRVYVAGENLFLLTKRKGLDPRFNYGIGSMTYGSGLSSGAYSTMRSITAGINITF